MGVWTQGEGIARSVNVHAVNRVRFAEVNKSRIK